MFFRRALAAKAPRILEKLGKTYRNSILQSDDESLRALQRKEAFLIERELPGFWAQDLKRQRGTQETQAVLFLDGYEGLWSEERSVTHFHRTDEWVRSWVDALPNVLWVVSGREELFWDEKKSGGAAWTPRIAASRVEELEPGFTREMLNAAGIDNPAVQNAIVETTGGNPFDVNLAIDFAREQTDAGQTLNPADFEGTRKELYERFFLYLGENQVGRYGGEPREGWYLGDKELPALELLAVPRTWDFALYRALGNEFGHPPSKVLFKQLLRFSFVEEQEDGPCKLHDRAREALHEYADTFDETDEIHQFLFEHFRSQFEDVAVKDLGPEHDQALEEAFYHATQTMSVDALAELFHGVQRPFENAALYVDMERMYSDLLSIQENEGDLTSVSFGATLNNLAELYKAQGRYGEAELLNKRALRIQEEQLGPNHPDVATTLNNLAVLYQAQGRYGEA